MSWEDKGTKSLKDKKYQENSCLNINNEQNSKFNWKIAISFQLRFSLYVLHCELEHISIYYCFCY